MGSSSEGGMVPSSGNIHDSFMGNVLISSSGYSMVSEEEFIDVHHPLPEDKMVRTATIIP
jgi:hypothetical protein